MRPLNHARWPLLQVICYHKEDWDRSPSDRRSTSRYCVLIEVNLISLRSKKQNTIVISSVEAEDHVMIAASKELAWLNNFLKELRLGDIHAIKLICDNQAAIHIASNTFFHEWTKHIEINY